MYLATQIGDNTKLLRSQAHYNGLELAQRPGEMVIETEGLARILDVCFDTPDELRSDEWMRCKHFIFMQINAWEYLYYQNRDRSIPIELWVGADASFKQIAGNKPGYIRFWSEWETAFDEPFRSYVSAEFLKSAASAQATTTAVPDNN